MAAEFFAHFLRTYLQNPNSEYSQTYNIGTPHLLLHKGGVGEAKDSDDAEGDLGSIL
jgi:hypothetical protein